MAGSVPLDGVRLDSPVSESIPDILVLDRPIEYVSLINIRPVQGNRLMEVEDQAVRARIRDVTFRLIGRGQALP
jgi:hypothetical protein